MDTIDTISCATAVGRPPAAATSVAPKAMATRALRRCIEAISVWMWKRESRHILRHLTDDELSDVGITRSEAMAEVSKSFFWD